MTSCSATMMTSEYSIIPQPVSTAQAAKALNIPLAKDGLVGQEAVPVLQMISTASSQLTDVNDPSTSLLTGYQMTAATGHKGTISIEESQNNSHLDHQVATLHDGIAVNYNAVQTSYEDCPVISGDVQASYWGQMVTSNADQIYHGHQNMHFNREQNVNRNPVTTASDDQRKFMDQMTTYSVQNAYGDKMKGDQIYYNDKMTVPNGIHTLHRGQPLLHDSNQTFYGGQIMPFETNKTLYGSQTMPLDSNQTFYGGQKMPHNSNQTLYGGQTIPFDINQSLYRSQMTISTVDLTHGTLMTLPKGNQTFYDSQMTTANVDQTVYGCQKMPLHGNQALHRGQKPTPSDEPTFDGNSMTPCDGNQSLYGGQRTIHNGEQTFSESQTMIPSSNASYYRAQSTGVQTLCGSQKTTPNEDQTFFGYQRPTLDSNLTIYGGQATTPNGEHTLKDMQMKTPSGDQTSNTGLMMSLDGSQMPYDDRIFNFSNSHLDPGQPSACSSSFPVLPGNCPKRKKGLRNQTKKKGKTHICATCGKSFSKPCHLKVHERQHTGEKPYECKSSGCTWRFARSDELSRHMMKHAGDKPFVCEFYSRAYSRKDYLKAHINRCQKRSNGGTHL